jgi:putative redox protein
MKIQLRRLKGFQQLATAQTRSVTIDQGIDKGGDDVGFRPTELWLIGLSSCSVTTMTRYAKEKGYPLEGVSIIAEDTIDDKGYITSITFLVKMEGNLSKDEKIDLLQYVKGNCKLLLTINPSIQLHYVEDKGEETSTGSVCTLDGGNCCI